MQILLIIFGVAMVAFMDRLQPDNFRKPKLNLYISSLGGILWLSGIIWSLLSYNLFHAALLLIASFVLGNILGIKK